MSTSKKAGFTIVELIVVIVAIGLLASLSVFGFSTWRTRTARTEVQNEVMNASMALKDNLTFNNVYPATGGLGSLYTPKGQVSLTYTRRADGASYCLVGTSTEVGGVTYYFDSLNNEAPSKTACS